MVLKHFNLHIYLMFLVFCRIDTAIAQEELESGEYYTIPKSKKNARMVSLNNMNIYKTKLYLGFDAGYKSSRATLSNTIDNLLAIQNNSEFYLGGTVGYNYNDRWAIETGYLKNNNRLTLFVGTGRGSSLIESEIKIPTIPIRYKYKIFTIDKATKTTTLWINTGLWFAPNSKTKVVDTFNLYSRSVIVQGDQYIYDTLTLAGQSYLHKRAIAQFEIGAELQGRVSDFFTISLAARGIVAPSSFYYTEIEYAVNNFTETTARHSIKPLNFSFNISFKYEFARMLKYKPRESI